MKDSNEASQTDRILRRLLGAAEPELTCEQCFELLDEYVEHELEGDAADERIPGMRPHLEGCSACHEEHETLLALLAADRRA